MPSFHIISKNMAAFRATLNELSQGKSGDKTLRVDKEEIVLNRFNGESQRDQKYRRHKASYKRDENNQLHGMELRKLSMLIFLNDDSEVNKSKSDKKGMLRLYPNGEKSVDGVLDISPRLGRAVLFKSEEMYHQVMSSKRWDNYIVTVHFTQVVNKPPKPHPIPKDWKIFISIASYRDLQLVHTIRSLVENATHPERLRIVAFNQWDYWGEWDKNLDSDLNRYLVEAAKLPKPPTILMENIWHLDAKNVYHARVMIQRHYNGETYQLQLDSHMRMSNEWDTDLIQMLHSCDAGDHSVITAYPEHFFMKDPKDGYSDVKVNPGTIAMRWY